MDSDGNIKSDYDKSRETYYELIDKGKDALELMIEVARESEHPRAFEVLSGMIKNISDVNDRLMDLNKKKLEITKPDVPYNRKNEQLDAPKTTNVFIGTNSEMQATLQQMMLRDQSDVIDITPEEKEA